MNANPIEQMRFISEVIEHKIGYSINTKNYFLTDLRRFSYTVIFIGIFTKKSKLTGFNHE